MLGNELHGLGNGPYVLGNGPFLLGIMTQFGIVTFGIMLHSRLCSIQHYVAFRVMSFGIMLFRIMSHSGLCRSA